MFPVLFKCPFFTIYTYGVFVAAAFVVSSWLIVREARRRGLNTDVVYNLSLTLLFGGIVAARLFYCALNVDYFLSRPLEIFMLHHGGLVWFGGFAGALLCGVIFLKRKRMPVLETCGLFAPYAALGQAIGRIGCFFNGCCYGRESVRGLYFPVHDAVLVPSQLIDALTLFVIFLILRSLSYAKSGAVLSFYLMLASLQRFFLEFIRGDVRPFYGGLSIFQWISIGIFAGGALLYARLKRCCHGREEMRD